MRLIVLLLAALLTRAAGEPETLPSSAGYLDPSGAPSGGQTVIAPWRLWTGAGWSELSTASQEACGAACWAAAAEPACALFDWRSCTDQSGNASCAGALHHTCRLFPASCGSVQPLAVSVAPGGDVRWASAGFPVRGDLLDGGSFDVRPGMGLVGGELNCEGSLVPGKCALARFGEASLLCNSMPDCTAATYYATGLDGCSEPLYVLAARRLSSGNFLGPTVAALVKVDPEVQYERVVHPSEGNFTLPSPADLAAAAAAAAQNGSGTNATRPYLGCFSGQGLLMAGTLVRALNSTGSPDACCRACRQDATCNVWLFCPDALGCNYTHGSRTFRLAGGQCELRMNELATEVNGYPVAVLARGEDVSFIGGAPLTAVPPQIEGFTTLPGITQFAAGQMSCPGNLKPELGECVLVGTPQELADACLSLPGCKGFTVKMGSWLSLGASKPGGMLKGSIAEGRWSVSPHSMLLLRQGPPSEPSAVDSPAGGGLSPGAVAGIAVGSVAAAAVTAAAAGLLVSRRRQVQAAAAGAKADNGCTSMELGFEQSSLPIDGSSCGLTDSMQQPIHLPSSVLVLPSTRYSPGPATPTPTSTTTLPFAGAAGTAGAQHADSTHSAAGSGHLDAVCVTCQRAASSATALGQPRAPLGAAPAAGSAVPLEKRPSMKITRRLSLPTSPRASPFATPSVSRPRFPPPPPLGAKPSGRLTSPNGSEFVIPELKEHIAACDAAISYGRHLASECALGAPVGQQPPLLSNGQLPAALQDWVVDPSQIEVLRAPDGTLLELGSGASATVYKVKLRGETVAAKEVDLGRSPMLQEQFVREAEQLHQLRHPHVVALYGVSLSPPRGILLMEYCAGRDLASCLQMRAAGSDRRLFGWYGHGHRVALEIVAAINFLHSRGIVHFDIKSSNVLLTGAATAKLADVGLARLQRGTHLSSTPMVGTFAWMAPEVIVGAKCSAAVDMFSLGVVIWELCTGERPQRGSMRAPQVPEECPQEVADLISQCMALDPSERPTAQQLLAQLEAMEAGIHPEAMEEECSAAGYSACTDGQRTE